MNLRLTRGALLFAFLVGLSLGTTGCSTFSRDWRAATATPHPPQGIEGRWEGMWRSDHNGHSGRLRALITRTEAGHYEARYHANYAAILSFGYTARLTARAAGGLLAFDGEADLGKAAGGVYRYDGRASATNFFSTYRCPIDHGTFQMARPR